MLKAFRYRVQLGPHTSAFDASISLDFAMTSDKSWSCQGRVRTKASEATFKQSYVRANFCHRAISTLTSSGTSASKLTAIMTMKELQTMAAV